MCFMPQGELIISCVILYGDDQPDGASIETRPAVDESLASFSEFRCFETFACLSALILLAVGRCTIYIIRYIDILLCILESVEE